MGQSRIWLVASVFALLCGELCHAQTSRNQRDYTVDAVKIDADIELTGRLSDPHWNEASVVQMPFEVTPGENTPSRQRTWVKILYNPRFIYFGFVCEDTDAAAIRAHVTDRDNNFQDDFVFVAVDPYRTNQRAYEFAVNPLGIQSDLMRTGNNEDASWDAVWYSKGAVSDTGYTVEVAIPFKSILFPSVPTQDWSVMLIRNWPRESRYQNSWTPIDRNDPCSICLGGTLKGLNGLQSTASVEVLPYVMGFQAGSLNDQSDPQSGFSDGKLQGRVGGGVRYAPDPSIAMGAVINPDFSQVESDATQISVNTTFAIFYAEKRPFFLDGADQFSSQITDFYSRMINNPLGAAKFSDKGEHLTVSYLGAADRNSPFIVPGEEGSSFVASSLRSFSNILRAKYDFGKQSFLGAIATTRNFSDAHNYTGGIDWNLLFDDNFTFLGQALLSHTKEINDLSVFSDGGKYGTTSNTIAFDGQSFTGNGLYSQFRRDARNYSFRLSYFDYSPTFQAQDGFVTANDLRTADFSQDLTLYPTDAFITAVDFFTESDFHFNYDNARKERWTATGVTLQMKSQTNVTLFYLPYNEELFHDVRFWKINRGELTINSSPMGAVQILVDITAGRFIHRVDNPTLGRGHNISLGLTLKPTARLELDANYSRSRLSDDVTGELFFDGYIGRLVAIYQFSGEVFVRLVSQYDKFNRAIEVDPLFSYKLNPFTILYAGSASSLTDFGDPFGVRQAQRQFFLKLQYLWRQ